MFAEHAADCRPEWLESPPRYATLTDELDALLPDHGDDAPPPRRPVTDRQRAHGHNRAPRMRLPLALTDARTVLAGVGEV